MDHKGQYQEGIIEAEDIKSAANRLKDQGLFIVKLDTMRRSLVLDDYFSSVKPIDLANLNKQLGVMVNAGIPLVSALEVVEKQTDNPKMQKVIINVKDSLREGKTFYHSLKQHPKIFDSMMLNMVQAGEFGGVLGDMLLRLGEHYEREHEVKEKVKAAMTYPAMVLVVSITAVILMIIFILPVYTVMLGEMSNELPVPTKILISFSSIIRTYWHLIILIILFFLVFIILYSRSATGKTLVDKIKIQFPLLGDLHKKVIVARFCRTLGTLLGAGVPILNALEITSKTTDNSVFMESLARCRDVVMDGKSMVRPLLDSGVFPYMVAHMAKVGEETGKLDSLLIQVGDYFQGEVDRRMDNLSKIIEPLMIIFVGALVGFLVLSMVLPMLTVISSF
ncbi:MAG: type II secretion system F family protein [Clostridia bacterium]|nr:type II secretion system F family protein [Clostridia bacterium]